MIADFGLSRVMEEQKLNLLTEICGTPGYMAPEIFKKTGHSKPVDIWAMGVITYFLLAGYTPFDRDTPQQEMEAIIAGNYKFEPEEYWANVSDTAKDFVRECLTIDPGRRPTAEEMLGHKWLSSDTPHFVPDPESSVGGPTDLLPHVKKAFNARRLWRKAALSIKAMNRMSALAGGPLGTNITAINENLRAMKEESEKERMEDSSITHHHHLHQPDDNMNDDVHENMRSAESKQQRDVLKGPERDPLEKENREQLKTQDDIDAEERAQTGEVESKLASMRLKEKE